MSRLEHLVQSLIRRLRQRRNGKLERTVGIALLVSALLFMGVVLIRGWREFRSHLSWVDVRLLALGELSILAAILLGAVMWSAIQRAMGLGFSWQEGMATHLVSGITKYIPGYAWQYLSKGYLSRKQGAPVRNVVLAMMTELVLLLAGGVALAALWGTLADRRGPFLQWVPHWAWLLIGVLSLFIALVWNCSLPALLRQKRESVTQAGLWFALWIGVVGWFLFSIAAWVMSRSLYPVPLTAFPQHAIALIVSAIAGILVIVVPGGLGVREVTLAWLLKGELPIEVGVLVSIMLRLGIVIGELIASAGVFWWKRRRAPDTLTAEASHQRPEYS